MHYSKEEKAKQIHGKKECQGQKAVYASRGCNQEPNYKLEDNQNKKASASGKAEHHEFMVQVELVRIKKTPLFTGPAPESGEGVEYRDHENSGCKREGYGSSTLSVREKR